MEITVRQALSLTFINYFTSELTPFAIGGNVAQVYFLNQDGIPAGAATAGITIKAILPSLFFMDFLADAGEAVGLIGLTGAGKTAIAEVLCGEKAAASGQIWLNTERAAAEQLAGNGVLIQRGSTLLENLSIPDNLFSLGRPAPTSSVWIQENKQRRQCKTLLAQFGMEEYLDASVPQLPPSVQHRLLMVGAVGRGKKFLALDHLSDGCTLQEQTLLVNCIRQLCGQGITVLYITGQIDSILQQMDRITVMDEPTSAITDREVATLFTQIKRLKAQNVAIIYISHKMDEIFQICDTITVLRDGKFIGTNAAADINEEQLIRMFFFAAKASP